MITMVKVAAIRLFYPARMTCVECFVCSGEITLTLSGDYLQRANQKISRRSDEVAALLEEQPPRKLVELAAVLGPWCALLLSVARCPAALDFSERFARRRLLA